MSLRINTGIKIRFKPLSLFEEYAFRDIDGAYWETKKLRDTYDLEEEYEINTTEVNMLNRIELQFLQGDIWEVDDTVKKSWGIANIYSIEQCPEYFI